MHQVDLMPLVGERVDKSRSALDGFQTGEYVVDSLRQLQEPASDILSSNTPFLDPSPEGIRFCRNGGAVRRKENLDFANGSELLESLVEVIPPMLH